VRTHTHKGFLVAVVKKITTHRVAQIHAVVCLVQCKIPVFRRIKAYCKP
jgi:hypothetical protein